MKREGVLDHALHDDALLRVIASLAAANLLQHVRDGASGVFRCSPCLLLHFASCCQNLAHRPSARGVLFFRGAEIFHNLQREDVNMLLVRRACRDENIVHRHVARRPQKTQRDAPVLDFRQPLFQL